VSERFFLTAGIFFFCFTEVQKLENENAS